MTNLKKTRYLIADNSGRYLYDRYDSLAKWSTKPTDALITGHAWETLSEALEKLIALKKLGGSKATIARVVFEANPENFYSWSVLSVSIAEEV